MTALKVQHRQKSRYRPAVDDPPGSKVMPPPGKTTVPPPRVTWGLSRVLRRVYKVTSGPFRPPRLRPTIVTTGSRRRISGAAAKEAQRGQDRRQREPRMVRIDPRPILLGRSRASDSCRDRRRSRVRHYRQRAVADRGPLGHECGDQQLRELAKPSLTVGCAKRPERLVTSSPRQCAALECLVRHVESGDSWVRQGGTS